MPHLIDQIKADKARRRNELLLYLMSQARNAQHLKNRTRRLIVDFPAEVPAVPTGFDAEQWPAIWNRFRTLHPFGIEVVMHDSGSLAESDADHFLRLRIDSIYHAATVLFNHLGMDAARLALLNQAYQNLNRRADELLRRIDLSHAECLALSKDLAVAFLNDASVLLAQHNTGNNHVDAKQVTKAAKQLEKAEQRYPCEAVQRDLLSLRFPDETLATLDTEAGLTEEINFSWEYYRRHYQRTAEQQAAAAAAGATPELAQDRGAGLGGAVPSATAHDPEGYDLANFAMVEQSDMAHFNPTEHAVTGQVRQLTSRAGTFSPLSNSHLNPHQKCLWAYRKAWQMLTDDAHQAQQAGQHTGNITHVHVHLITASGPGGRAQSQYKQFMHTRLASYALINPSELTLGDDNYQASFIYLCIGINKFRRYHSNQQYGLNAMAMIQLYRRYYAFLPTDNKLGLPPFASAPYVTALETLQTATQVYLAATAANPASRALAGLRQRVKDAEQDVHRMAIPLANVLRERVLSSKTVSDLVKSPVPAKPAADDAAGWQQFHCYYGTQCMQLIQQLMPYVNHSEKFGRTWRNVFKGNALSNSKIGIIQSLITVLANAIDVFSSFGCKSANDRAFLVALLIHSLADRINKGKTITAEDVEEIKEAIKPDFASRGTHYHAQLDLRGGTQKFSDTSYVTSAPGYKSSKKLAKAAPHMLLKDFKPRTTLRFAGPHYAATAFYTDVATFHDHLNMALEHRYIAACREQSRLSSLFHSHNRAGALTILLGSISRCPNVHSAIRLLWLQYSAIKRGQLKGLLQQTLVAFVDHHFGGVAVRRHGSKGMTYSLQDAFVGNEIIPHNGECFSLTQHGPEQARAVAVRLNKYVYKATQKLFAVAEATRALHHGLADLYRLIERLNGCLVIELAAADDLVTRFNESLAEANNILGPAFSAFDENSNNQKVNNELAKLREHLPDPIQVDVEVAGI